MHLGNLFHSYLNVIAWFIALGTCAYALRQIKQGLREGQVPLLGVGGVFILLLQLLTVSMSPGLRGHFCGTLLLTMLLGPWVSCLIVAAVVLVQALLFSQGSLIGFGSNVFSLGVVAGMGGYYLLTMFKALFPKTRNGFLTATAVAAWGSLVFAFLTVNLNLILAGATINQRLFLTKTTILGMGEAIITTSIIAVLLTARPDLVLAYCCGSDKDSCYEEHHHHRTHHHH